MFWPIDGDLDLHLLSRGGAPAIADKRRGDFALMPAEEQEIDEAVF